MWRAHEVHGLGLLYYFQGKYDEAEPLFKRALAIAEKALGKDHPAVATSLNGLALLYDSQGKYDEAEPLYQAGTGNSRESPWKRPSRCGDLSLDSLAVLYDSEGKYAEAEPLHKRALGIWEKALGKDHPRVATSLNNLALLYDSQGKYAEAEALYERSTGNKGKSPWKRPSRRGDLS